LKGKLHEIGIYFYGVSYELDLDMLKGDIPNGMWPRMVRWMASLEVVVKADPEVKPDTRYSLHNGCRYIGK